MMHRALSSQIVTRKIASLLRDDPSEAQLLPQDKESAGAKNLAAAAELPVGEACVFGKSALVDFSGFLPGDVALASNASECASGVCLSNHFQGRVQCPYGQTEQEITGDGPERCRTPQ